MAGFSAALAAAGATKVAIIAAQAAVNVASPLARVERMNMSNSCDECANSLQGRPGGRHSDKESRCRERKTGETQQCSIMLQC
ncbi:MAG TPA: hypothetical protein VH814_02390 [Steroidobacteraceae bacterium]